MYKEFNANPVARRAEDCTVRAISKVTGESWEKVYIGLCAYGLSYCDMPSANYVWGAYLTDKGFTKHVIPNTCPNCYTVAEFAEDNPKGAYILALRGHVVAVVDGDYFDTWDSGDEVPLYYWEDKNV